MLGLNDDEIRFYDALADNESVRELSDDAEEDRARTDRQPAQESDGGLVETGKCARDVTADGQADSQEIQVPARSAGCGGGTGFAAG